MDAVLTVTPRVVGLLAGAGGLDLTPERAGALVPAVQALLAGDARLAALNLHVVSAAGTVWPDVPDD
ncbi:hypothetical protein [Deinococcus budaensis]|uniref:Uncharacterized protein (DUF697 family) n=1 Tax=Deinococcus budaensis TaxID=1665626 RepID=A0A7W8LQH0_9DEIO|nr:hypothetical protein [Deinococcus budaensis]MBB5234831.1 uncharacterized protein (DUF697 family) [Deinococcus budaensis]